MTNRSKSRVDCKNNIHSEVNIKYNVDVVSVNCIGFKKLFNDSNFHVKQNIGIARETEL